MPIIFLVVRNRIAAKRQGSSFSCRAHTAAPAKNCNAFLAEKSPVLPRAKNRLQRSPMLRPRLIGLLLALATLLVYLPVAGHGFSLFDDDDYITQNPVVQTGATWAGVKWAFTTLHASNWHPLTWLSHMADCELFGLNPGAHHLVNALFHAVNTALLFTLLFRLTAARAPAAFVAALFAWHPLHVESVAWVSERKDVLSTCFGLLALLAYARYAQKQPRVESRGSKANAAAPVLVPRPSTLDYSMALVCFALGLMAKPMLVTLPFVMLLLDYWPLQRLSTLSPQPSTLRRLVLEKWPFFLLTAASCAVTFLAQHRGGMVVSLDEMSPAYRLGNVPLVYLRYLSKIFWPANLAIFYPLPKALHPGIVITASVVLIAICAVAWLGRRRHPYAWVGWLWFLGTLVPVVGLVQVGQAAMSDRYTYFPSLGLFLAVTFAFRDWADRFRWPPAPVWSAAVLILGGCVWITENQLRWWRDDEALFTRAVSVTRDNEPAHLCLAQVYETRGRPADAAAEYRTALRLNPRRVKTYNSFALLLARSGRTNEALAELRQALQWFPADAATHDSLANLLADAGRPGEALAEFQAAVRLDPAQPVYQNNLGALLAEIGRLDEAREHYARAAQLNPADWRAPYLTGKALLKAGRDGEAVARFRESLRNDPDNLQTLTLLAQVLASSENPEVRDGRDALALASRANDLTGGTQPAVLDALAMACAELARFDEAQKNAQEALRLALANGQPNDAAILQQRLALFQQRQPFRQSFARKP
jgi:protein O-mannosyl-transferase